MDNVLGQVLLTAGDENLAAGDGIGAVIVFLGRSGQIAHVATGIGCSVSSMEPPH